MRLFVTFIFLLHLFEIHAQQLQSNIKAVNMPYDEQNPVLSPDGLTLFFTIANHAQNVGGLRDPGDIWVSTWTGEAWTEPRHAGTVINDKAYNAVVGFSADGHQMFLVSHYSSSGVAATTQGISVSELKNGSWSRPQNIAIPYFQNKSSFQSGFITPDGSVLVYSAETYGSYGVEDIYVSRKGSDGRWSEPKNLGRTINTSFQEVSPSLSSDGRTLYFSTNGRKGFGSFDVYASTRLDDSWTTWTEPENLGETINSEGRELFYKYYAQSNMAVYTSTKNSDGYGDVKFHKATDSTQTVMPALVAQPPLPEEPKEKESYIGIKVTGKVLNGKTGEPVQAKLLIEINGVHQTVQTNSVGFSTILPTPRLYSIRVEAPGYIHEIKSLDLTGYEMNTLETNFSLQPIEVGTTVVLKNILFKQSKPELLPESYKELNEVVAFMKDNPAIEIELSGHTDNRGSFRQLLSLSQQRVNKVKDYLVSKGISSKRITGKGYGGQKPVAGNDTEESRALNRRVEFTIKKK
jgi:OmpA-OmpF porin, OOP family